LLFSDTLRFVKMPVMLRKILLPAIFAVVSLLILGLSITRPISAASLEECEKEDLPADKISECIEVLSNKDSELGEQKKTLASQIAQFDSQIHLTQLKIADAQATIDKLEKEIGVLGFRIGYITDSVERLETLLKQRIVATYQQSFVSNLELILTSKDFSDFVLRVQYLKQVQENDRKILTNLQESRSNYANEKDEREEKQAAIEENKEKLLGLKTSLDQQKVEKQVLLSRTQSDESRYQRLLAQAQAELAVAFGGGQETFLRDVKVGEKIGNVISGPSACSTGTHLHFEVHKNGSIEDPNNYLSSTSFQYAPNESEAGSINPHGSWPWPIDNPINISQGFGMTPYARSGAYNGNPHFGIDMYNSGGAFAVKATNDGKLYGGSVGCGGRTLYYGKVDGGDGLKTYYLHTVPN